MDCAILALASVLDVSKEQIVKDLGHDGLTVVYPHLVGHKKYKGIHHQEYLDVCIKHGYTLTYIEANPLIGQPGYEPKQVYENPWQRFQLILSKHPKALLHLKEHCVAKVDDTIIDRGRVKLYKDFDGAIYGAWLLYRIKS